MDLNYWLLSATFSQTWNECVKEDRKTGSVSGSAIDSVMLLLYIRMSDICNDVLQRLNFSFLLRRGDIHSRPIRESQTSFPFFFFSFQPNPTEIGGKQFGPRANWKTLNSYSRRRTNQHPAVRYWIEIIKHWKEIWEKKKKMNKSVKAAPQTCPEIDSGTLSESDRVLMSVLSFGPPF